MPPDLITVVERIFAFIRSLFTPEQWAVIAKELADGFVTIIGQGSVVLTVTLLAYCTTELYKRIFRHVDALPNPKDWTIQAMSLLSSIVWSVSLFYGRPVAQLAAASVISAFASIALATVYYKKIRPRWFGREDDGT